MTEQCAAQAPRTAATVFQKRSRRDRSWRSGRVTALASDWAVSTLVSASADPEFGTTVNADAALTDSLTFSGETGSDVAAFTFLVNIAYTISGSDPAYSETCFSARASRQITDMSLRRLEATSLTTRRHCIPWTYLSSLVRPWRSPLSLRLTDIAENQPTQAGSSITLEQLAVVGSNGQPVAFNVTTESGADISSLVGPGSSLVGPGLAGPEPSPWILIALGLALVFGSRRMGLVRVR